MSLENPPLLRSAPCRKEHLDPVTERPSTAPADQRETESTLSMLHAIGVGERVTQRGLAHSLGIALGLTNVYLKRCVKKGLIKVRKAPARRYAYYVTAKGFAEKARLTRKFLSHSFDFFRAARQDCADLFTACERQGLRRVALIGASDLSEIAILAALSSGMTVVAVVDAEHNSAQLAGVPVVQNLSAAGPFDLVMVTNIKQPQEVYEQLAKSLAPSRILTPDLLRVARAGPPAAREAAE